MACAITSKFRPPSAREVLVCAAGSGWGGACASIASATALALRMPLSGFLAPFGAHGDHRGGIVRLVVDDWL